MLRRNRVADMEKLDSEYDSVSLQFVFEVAAAVCMYTAEHATVM